MYNMQSPSLPSVAAEQSLCQAPAGQSFRYRALDQCRLSSRRPKGGSAAPRRPRDQQVAGSSASSQAPAKSNALPEADMRSMQSVQSPALGSEGILDVLMQSAELLLIIGVAGAQGSRLLAFWQQHQQAQDCTNAHKHKVQEMSMAVESSWLVPVPDAVLSSGTHLALALVVLLSWVLRKRMSLRQTRMASQAGLSAGVRLMRLEVLATRQAQALLAAERQITKLNTRARLLGKDLQPPLRQVQAENVQQAESLVRLTEKVESLNGDIEDTQQLIGALHGATAKQLQLVMQALTLSQAAKALAQSVSSQLASQSGAAGTNGVPSLQGTDIHMPKLERIIFKQMDRRAG
ncbi:hypothetical protein CVIRNUC_005992 [Coccomyxa viridis]|uniref:Uncharacterized protein n=1 Tax=Coccomyxa viridis TaxID=1274662 RepID=A0AAV1I7U6_9CHLO|nr:hypothetical protein CVIRNUC_005992 [Coccomyxa viridis]